MTSLVGVKAGDKVMVHDRTGRQPFGRVDPSRYVEREVTKVGRKYVTVAWADWLDVQFKIEDGYEFVKGGYTGYGKAYTLDDFAELGSRKVALDIIEAQGIEFKGKTAERLTLVQLQKIGLVLTGHM